MKAGAFFLAIALSAAPAASQEGPASAFDMFQAGAAAAGAVREFQDPNALPQGGTPFLLAPHDIAFTPPDAATDDDLDYAYGAFQRGHYLTARDIALARAETGDATSAALLGVIHAGGYGVTQDHAAAAVWFEQAVEGGDPRAMIRLAELYYAGIGVEEDTRHAADLLEQAFDVGVAEAGYGLGIIRVAGTGRPADDRLGLIYMEAAAEAGHVEAQYTLGTMLLDGVGTPADPVAAAFWTRTAADAGHIEAMVDYAIMAFNGVGVTANEEVAAAWFAEAARHGSPLARNQLARLYAFGRGVPRDLDEARRLHALAVAAGIDDALLDEMLATAEAP